MREKSVFKKKMWRIRSTLHSSDLCGLTVILRYLLLNDDCWKVRGKVVHCSGTFIMGSILKPTKLALHLLTLF